MQVCWLSVLSTLLPTDGLVYDRDPPSEDHLESPLKKQRSSCISRRGPISQRHVGSALNQSRLAGSQRIGNASTRSACSSRLPHSTPGRWLGKPGSPDGELKALGRQVPVSNRLQQAVCPVRLSDLQRPAAAVDTDVLIGVPISHPDHEGRQVQPSRWHRGKHPSRTPVLLVVGGASVKSAAGPGTSQWQPRREGREFVLVCCQADKNRLWPRHANQRGDLVAAVLLWGMTKAS